MQIIQLPEIKKINYSFKRKSHSICESVNCYLQINTSSTTGWGNDLFYLKARKKSFSEAFEHWVQNWSVQSGIISAESSSNGFAAHPEIEKAIQNALFELIDRCILLEIWNHEICINRYEAQTLVGKILTKDISKKCDLYLFACTIQTKKKIYYWSCGLTQSSIYGTNFDSNLSDCLFKNEKKILFSLSNFIENKKKLKTKDQLPHSGRPEDHLEFYLNPKNNKAFDFLIHQKNPISYLCLDTDGIKTQVYKPDLKKIKLWTAHASHPTWPKLCWGQSSIQNLNLWPHPLA